MLCVRACVCDCGCVFVLYWGLSTLSSHRFHVCIVLCLLYSLDGQIKESVREVGSLLAKVSGTGQVSLSQPAQRNIIQQESDTVLQPLMDFLDGSLTMFAQVCEKTILKRLLKVRQLTDINSGVSLTTALRS